MLLRKGGVKDKSYIRRKGRQKQKKGCEWLVRKNEDGPCGQKKRRPRKSGQSGKREEVGFPEKRVKSRRERKCPCRRIG